MQEEARLWQAEAFSGLEFLRAFYVKHSFPRHTHEFYVIGTVERGIEAFFNQNQMQYAKKGDISLTNPDEIHTGHAGTNEGYLYRAFYPTPELLQKVAEDVTGKAQNIPFFPKAVVPDAEVSGLLLKTHKSFEGKASRLEREEKLYKALGLLILRHADTTLNPKPLYNDSILVNKVREFLHEHVAEQVTLEQLAALVNVTPTYIARLFKKTVGLPPHEYQTQLRVKKAKHLLQTSLSSAEVALETGFYDQSHLNKHFKRLVGVTAGQYRASARTSYTVPYDAL
jgi:AraC-like DNA-binding protein